MWYKNYMLWENMYGLRKMDANIGQTLNMWPIQLCMGTYYHIGDHRACKFICAYLTSPGCVARPCIRLASKHHRVVAEDESSGTSHCLGEATSVVGTLAGLAVLSGLGAVLYTDGPDPVVPSGCHFVPSSRVHPLVYLNPSGVCKLILTNST